MTKYEYKFVQETLKYARDTPLIGAMSISTAHHDLIESHAAEGWRLSQVIVAPDTLPINKILIELIFERPLP